MKLYRILLLQALLMVCSPDLFAAAPGCDTTRTIKCVSVYPSGYKKEESSYRNGLRHGVWTVFSEDGKIIRKTKYRNGTRLWEFRYANNIVIESINRKGVIKKVKDCGC